LFSLAVWTTFTRLNNAALVVGMLRSVYFQKFTQNNLNLNCLSMFFVFKISDYFDHWPYLKRFNKQKIGKYDVESSPLLPDTAYQ
jgi:hypothetical protein